jgi:hypothetical protein
MSIKQWRTIAICLLVLILIGSIYQAKAAPLVQQAQPDHPVDFYSTPAVNISTKLQPYQIDGVAPLEADNRLLQEMSQLVEVPETGHPVPLSSTPPSPAIDIRTRLQPYQKHDDVLTNQSDGRRFEVADVPTEPQEAPIGVLAQQTFSAVADATVLQGYPTLNFGDTSDMWAGYDDYLNPDGRIVRSLIRFDIASLPANQTITKATLRVYLLASKDFPNTFRSITTYRVGANWSESSVTWNNAPGYGTTYGSTSVGYAAWGWYEFNVTNLVKDWINGTYPNYGIMLRGPEFSGSDSSWRGFSTRNGPYTPQLIIEFQSATTLNPPSNLSAIDVSASQINLAWQDNSDNEASFKIERSPNGASSWIQIATVGANVTAYANTGLTPSTLYYYRVRASNATSDSNYSNIASATTPSAFNNNYTYLPIILRAPVPPPDGHWTGTTSRGQPMSFNVSSKGATWSNFKLKTDYSFGGCSGTVEVTLSGPGTITNNQFSSTSGAFSFSGQLTSLTSATGTYSFVNSSTGCGLLNQSGTWTANLP